MTHVTARLNERITDEDERAMVARNIASTIEACKRDNITDVAVRVWRAAGKRASDDGSNGETAVLIVRGGQGVTLMWRRASQPFTPDALRVKRVLYVKGTK